MKLHLIKNSLILSACLFVLFLNTPPVTALIWRIETVDSTGDVGKWTSIALDAGGTPHISYRDTTNGDLKYATKTDATWSIETVDSEERVIYDMFTSIALDSNNNPHISYYDSTNEDLKYTTKTDATWSIETIDSGGQYTSIALDSNNNPHISYFLSADLKYATKTGTTWSTEEVAATHKYEGLYTSIAVDAEGTPHISYFDREDLDLMYATKTGATWSIEIVESDGRDGMWTSIAVDAGGTPHISYYDNSNSDLKYATKTGPTTWSIETVDSGGYVGGWTSIALDAGDRPHISYYDSTNGDLKYTTKTGATWSIETVDSGGDVGTYTSIALDTGGTPHISYYDSTNGDLKYAITIDVTPPDLSSPADIAYEEGMTGYNISWTVGDRYPDTYDLYNNTVLVDSDVWMNGTVAWNVDGLAPGTNNVTLVVWDAANNSVPDTVWVTVSAATPPDLSSPADIAYEEGMTGYNIIWTIGDRYPDTYELYNNTVLMDSDVWTNATIAWNVDGLAAGTYNFTLVVRDVANHTTTDTVFVTVTTLPATTLPELEFSVPGMTAVLGLAALTALGMRRKRR